MPLYDFHCRKCTYQFESLVPRSGDKTADCPKCGTSETDRQIARFRVGGRGDLRESTEFHGCHLSHDILTGNHGHEEHHHSGGCCGTGSPTPDVT